MSASEVFRPTNGSLLVRGNIAHGEGVSADKFKKDHRPESQGGYRFGQLSHNSFFARHNPHPSRVRHLKGLLDVPICSVNDLGGLSNPRYSLQFPPNNHDETKLSSYHNIPVNAINVNSQRHPINTITGIQYFQGKALNQRIFREKAVPTIGMGMSPLLYTRSAPPGGSDRSPGMAHFIPMAPRKYGPILTNTGQIVMRS